MISKMGICFCAQVYNLLAFVILLFAFLASHSESRAHHKLMRPFGGPRRNDPEEIGAEASTPISSGTCFESSCKVHNLALYPERHSWCQATPIRQEVAYAPECEPVTIDNVVCLGACFSYSVPRAQDYEPIAPYCDKCDKTTSSWTVVTLNCTKASTGEHYQMTRNVEMISNCSCVDCNDNSLRKKSTSSSAEDNADSQEDGDEGGAVEGNELDDSDSTSEVDDDVDDSLASIPTLHKLKSVSAELQELHSKADEETMIQDNKIPSDDDHDHDSTRKERERQRALATDHDL